MDDYQSVYRTRVINQAISFGYKPDNAMTLYSNRQSYYMKKEKLERIKPSEFICEKAFVYTYNEMLKQYLKNMTVMK